MDEGILASSLNQLRSSHFTYVEPNGADLCQGDVLRKTGRLGRLIGEVHPHYTGDSYTHFMVLTQSCDLVRRARNAVPKARYVTLAAVRSLSLVIERRIREEQDEVALAAGVCAETKREAILNFLTRLLNNNEPDFFYLHEDPGRGFSESSCAFLRLPIAIRAQEHYDICLEDRCLSLAEGFRAKLGWLVGNIYSRVGTEDWVPDHEDGDAFKKRLNDLLHYCTWVPTDALNATRKQIAGKPMPPRDELQRLIDTVPYDTRRDRVLKAVVRSLQQMSYLDASESIDDLAKELANDPRVAQLLK